MLYLVFVTALFGLAVGSFLNVLIYRLPRSISVAHGFSMCPGCEHRLYPKDLIPLFSWLFLRGKCRYCGARISAVYPLVELANALLWVGMVLRFGFTVEAFAYAVVSSCLLVVAFVDWQHMEIPDSMDLVIGLMGLLLIFTSDRLTLAERLIGIACVAGPMLLLALLSGGRAMGGGDIKLMAALGLCLGWKLTLFTTFLGAILGSITFVILSKTNSKMGRLVPFGTFLAVAGVIAIFFGDAAIGWYLGLLVSSHAAGCSCGLH